MPAYHSNFSFHPLYLCRAYRSGNQTSIPSGTYTKVAFNAESYDPSNLFDSTTNYRFTAPTPGYYKVSACVNFRSLTNDKIYSIALYKNGSPIIYAPFCNGSQTQEVSAVINDIVSLTTNDYLEVYVYQNTGGSSVFLLGGSAFTYFTIGLYSLS